MNSITVNTTSLYTKLSVASRVESQTPAAYRLAKQKDGTLVLQGAYEWSEGSSFGHEWRDIPTVEE